ncbi:hypothetical protein AXK12_05040 [Cephaloticoccus capnophilus]|uniref:Uncharacterized protein n=1 Tax=Cephaloticoccus capnophilus TaxID=1548208 RepID=A0A139SM55_9BACT|nr:hypothetical protein AXK12_05040 [Cephaloticoccus capnophilus]
MGSFSDFGFASARRAETKPKSKWVQRHAAAPRAVEKSVSARLAVETGADSSRVLIALLVTAGAASRSLLGL